MKSSRSFDQVPKETSFLKYRQGGILLHPTCLPGIYGIGDLGLEFYNSLIFYI